MTEKTNIAPRYLHIASALAAKANCERHDNGTWLEIWDEVIRQISDSAPKGSGFDCGSEILILKSDQSTLRFYTQYHHMDDNGFYCGWSSHHINVKPAFIGGFDMVVHGQDRNQIKDYIAEVFHHWLSEPIDLNPIITAARKALMEAAQTEETLAELAARKEAP